MKKTKLVLLALISLPTFAETISLSQKFQENSIKHATIRSLNQDIHEIDFNLASVEAEVVRDHAEFTQYSSSNLSFSQDVGAARVPFRSVVVAGSPADIQVTIDPKQSVEVSSLAAPAQEQDCRCDVPKKKTWAFNKSSYLKNSFYRVESLGKYRGTPLSRVTVFAAQADLAKGVTRFYPELKAQITSKHLDLSATELTSGVDFLIVSPEALIPGLVDFVSYKQSKGLNVKVVKLEDIGKDVPTITKFFKSEYADSHYKYALVVGTDFLFPNHAVNTSGSWKTPSDYPFFTMDADDMIPDVHYGRIVASTADEVHRQTQKWMDYQNRVTPVAQLKKMIGIASNEGSNPSDNDYVQGIENDLNAGYGFTASHFYQKDIANSNTAGINKALEQGAGFLVYVGHGSGTSWASTAQSYSNTSIQKLRNADVLKPVIIDVACQNGTLKKNYFGETFMNATDADGKAIGASMYYGGSVNISWDPPAIMARGMAKKAVSDKIQNVSDMIFAGQMYLMENYTDSEAVKDNWEWYHLFGDPSSEMYFN